MTVDWLLFQALYTEKLLKAKKQLVKKDFT